ncbi:MAG: hypothetical protein OEX19_04310 [Gammaproteobacteria bacterium]|nr:hypothetical protein [Gammaproteobacteria bacterium]
MNARVVLIFLSLLIFACSNPENRPITSVPVEIQEIEGTWTNEDEILLDGIDPTTFTYTFYLDGSFEGSIISYNGCSASNGDSVCDTWYSWEKQLVGTYSLEDGKITLMSDNESDVSLTINDFKGNSYLLLSSDEYERKMFVPQ